MRDYGCFLRYDRVSLCIELVCIVLCVSSCSRYVASKRKVFPEKDKIAGIFGQFLVSLEVIVNA